MSIRDKMQFNFDWLRHAAQTIGPCLLPCCMPLCKQWQKTTTCSIDKRFHFAPKQYCIFLTELPAAERCMVCFARISILFSWNVVFSTIILTINSDFWGQPHASNKSSPLWKGWNIPSDIKPSFQIHHGVLLCIWWSFSQGSLYQRSMVFLKNVQKGVFFFKW